MSPFASRVLVAVIGLPVVLLVVHAGGWWLFALGAVAAAKNRLSGESRR